MKRLFVLALCVAAVGLSGFQHQARSPWQEAYSPTRLEWLATMCNAMSKEDHGVLIQFYWKHPNVITIGVVCSAEFKSQNRDSVQDAISRSEKLVSWCSNVFGDIPKVKTVIDESVY